MERTLHNTLLLLSPQQLTALHEWASEELEYNRYMRKAESKREREQYWSGRIPVAQLIKSECDLCRATLEDVYNDKRREPLSAGK